MFVKNILRGVVNYIRRMDVIFFLIILTVSIYSLLLLKSVSRATRANYFSTQLLAIIIGFIGSVVVSMIDYADFAKFWKLIAGFSVFLMLYTYFTAEKITNVGGVSAAAWITIAGRTFQTSEIVKIAFIITYAKHLDLLKKKGKHNNAFSIVFLCIHALVPVLLCHLQGDDGAGIVFIAIFLVMSVAAGIHWKYFAILGILALIAIPVLWNFVLLPYQKLRFTAVMNLDDDGIADAAAYQQFQGRLSIGSGQLSGLGYQQGRRVATNVVSFQQSDFIYSVVGEEFGFVGCVLIIVIFLLLLIKILHIASVSRDEIGKYICFGYFGLIALQALINIGMCLAILPVMGLTLPFFSSGGSSAMCLYLGVGLVQGVYMRRKESDGTTLRRKDLVRFSYKQMKQM